MRNYGWVSCLAALNPEPIEGFGDLHTMVVIGALFQSAIFPTRVQLLQVLPALEGLRGEALLKELHRRWISHNLMVRWLSRFFGYLDR